MVRISKEFKDELKYLLKIEPKLRTNEENELVNIYLFTLMKLLETLEKKSDKVI
jgi:hypothetical protein